MKREDTFFYIFLATILFTRIFLYFTHWSAGYIGPFRLHHYMYGIVLILLGLALRNVWIYGIGWGLVVDELMIFPTHATTWAEYYSPIFLIGTGVFAVTVFFLRKYLMRPLLRG
jgi:hypothetical protein